MHSLLINTKLYMKTNFLLLLIILSGFNLLGQGAAGGPVAVDYFRKGEQALMEKSYKTAIRWFERSLKQQPDFLAAKRSLGFCYQLLNDFKKASTYYQEVLTSDSLFSRALYFELGDLYYKTGKYKEAVALFTRFDSLLRVEDHHFSGITEREQKSEKEYIKKYKDNIVACQVFMDSVKLMSIESIQNLGDRINTKDGEYFPFLSNDQKELFFTRQKKELADEDLYIAVISDTVWRSVEPVSSFNTKEVEGMCTFVRDGRRLYFTACNREGVMGTCDVWQAEMDKNKSIHEAGPMQGRTNSEYWDSQASISCDGSKLYFSSSRPGGLGAVDQRGGFSKTTDIWFCTRLPDGSWGPPQNLGSNINTPDDEQAPFITNDGKTLYFTSEGHPGMGGQDLFMSRLGDDGNWSRPLNLGPPVNTPYDELGFFLSANGSTGYFASNRPGGFGNMDIYRFTLSDELYTEPVTFVEGFIVDSLSGTPVAASIGYNKDGHLNTDASGRFFLCLPANSKLSVQVVAKGYFTYSNYFYIPEWENKNFFNLEIPLASSDTAKVKKDRPVLPDPEEAKKRKYSQQYQHSLFFEFDKYVLSAEAIENLDEFIAKFTGKEIQRIEIIGFSDDIGADLYNLKLSEERAKQIALHLRDKGLLVDQIYIEGRGEVKDDRPKRENRKVDIRVFTME